MGGHELTLRRATSARRGAGSGQGAAAVEWLRDDGLVPYEQACAWMEARAAAVREQGAPEAVRLLEHPPLYTAGTSAQNADLLDARFPVHPTGRGGRYTYHGPGQRVGYLVLDLAARGADVRAFVHGLERWLVAALAELTVPSWTRPGHIGLWTHDTTGREAKVGAIGVRVRRWVSFHGFAINVAPDLSHFAGIIPCGLPDPITSLAALGVPATLADLDVALLATFDAFLWELGRNEAARQENDTFRLSPFPTGDKGGSDLGRD